MKTETQPDLAAPTARDSKQELRPLIEAIVKMAELLKTTSGDDENVRQILTAARKLLDVVAREADKPSGSSESGESKMTEQCDVLYIEDDPDIFEAIELLLSSTRALKVFHATNGQTGLAVAKTRVPKLILLDLNLPDIHGSEVMQQLRKDPVTAGIPVIVISGYETPSEIERLLVLGARNYLTKPLTTQPFLAVIDQVLQTDAAARI
jgi:hypothetical protein